MDLQTPAFAQWFGYTSQKQRAQTISVRVMVVVTTAQGGVVVMIGGQGRCHEQIAIMSGAHNCYRW